MTSYVNALSLTKYLVNEVDYTPLAAASTILTSSIGFCTALALLSSEGYIRFQISQRHTKVGFEPVYNEAVGGTVNIVYRTCSVHCVTESTLNIPTS